MNYDELDLIWDQLDSFTEKQVSRIPAPGVWSAKQVLGHLVDSAANNHARWVRMALEDNLTFPTWDQEGWMRLQDWQTYSWAEILELWFRYNLHLARLREILPPESLSHRAQVGTLGAMTLAEVIEHYERHLLHHLAQIRERAGA